MNIIRKVIICSLLFCLVFSDFAIAGDMLLEGEGKGGENNKVEYLDQDVLNNSEDDNNQDIHNKDENNIQENEEENDLSNDESDLENSDGGDEEELLDDKDDDLENNLREDTLENDDKNYEDNISEDDSADEEDTNGSDEGDLINNDESNDVVDGADNNSEPINEIGNEKLDKGKEDESAEDEGKEKDVIASSTDENIDTNNNEATSSLELIPVAQEKKSSTTVNVKESSNLSLEGEDEEVVIFELEDLDHELAVEDVYVEESFLTYLPGEIIVKYKNKDNKKTMLDASLFFDENDVEEENLSDSEDNNIKIYKSRNFRNKINHFTSKIRNKISENRETKNKEKVGLWGKLKNKFKKFFKMEEEKEVDANLVIPTDEFGDIDVDLDDLDKMIDPYTENVLSELNDDPDIEYAELNMPVSIFVSTSTNPLYNEMWSLENIAQNYPISGGVTSGAVDADIDAETAWLNDISQGGKDIVVAVIDTGIDYAHEDLGACSLEDVNDQDPLTCPKFVPGYDFVNMDNDPMDDHGHGTHCAGTIGALDNDLGILGVAPGVKLMAVKGLSDHGGGDTWGLAQAVQWAVDHGAQVLSNSWGGKGDSKTLRDAFQYAYDHGVVSIAAAGNDYGEDAFYYVPAGFDTVITVGASDSDDEIAYFSNIGSKIDVVAPGVDILSLKSQYYFDYYDKVYRDNYLIMSGTSMATPHVAGAAALILANYPDYTSEQVRQALRTGADDLGDVGFDNIYGYGRLNLNNSLLIVDEIPSLQITSPENNSEVFVNTNIEYNYIYASGTLSDIGLYYRSTDSSDLHPIACASSSESVTNGVVVSVQASCEFDTTVLLGGDYYIVLRAINQSANEFYDAKKISIKNVEITNIRGGDVYRLNNNLSILGKVVSGNFSIEWSVAGENNWSQDGMSTSTVSGFGEVFELGHWNSSVASSSDYYDLRAKIGLDDYLVEQVYMDSNLKEGWPVKIDWDENDNSFSGLLASDDDIHYIEFLDQKTGQIENKAFKNQNELNSFLQEENINSYLWGGNLFPVVANVVGDDKKELIVSKIGEPSNVFIYGDDGTLLQTITVEPFEDHSNIGIPVVEDINNDGVNEILFYVSNQRDIISTLYAFTGDGNIVSDYPINLPFNNHADITSADLDNDGVKEIIVLENSTFSTRSLYIIKNAQIYNQFLVEDSNWWNMSGVYSAVAVGNFDDDSDLEIVVAGPGEDSDYDYDKEEWYLEGVIAVYNIDGSFVEDWPVTVDENIWSSPVVGDLDNDGDNEVVIGTNNGMYAFDHQGNILSGWPLYLGDSFWSTASLADMNNDNMLEIAFSKLSYSNTYLVDYHGTLSSGWPVDPDRYDIYSTNIADLNNDGLLDVFSLNGDKVYTWGLDGDILEGFPKFIGSSLSSNYGVTVADMDNDGSLELFATLEGGYDMQNSISKHRGDLLVWDLNTEYNSTSTPWPTFQHDNQRTGYYIRSANIDIPINLTVNGENPGTWTNSSNFVIDWDNSQDDYPLVWYKLGSAPTSDEDGIATSVKPFVLDVETIGEQLLYVWFENNEGEKDYRRYASVELRYDINPFPPENLTANGYNPSLLYRTPDFEIDWDNPSGAEVVRYWYKLDSVPTSPDDGIATSAKPFVVNATKSGGQNLYLWLEDEEGHKSHDNYASVVLNYRPSPPAVPENVYILPKDQGASIFWEKDDNLEVKYNIYQSLSSDFADYILVNDSPVEGDLYTVTGLDNGTTYYFAVTAINNQESAMSAKEFVTPYAGPYYQLGEVVKISASGISSQYEPQIHENKIVWMDDRHGNLDIYMYDLDTKSETRITSNVSAQYTPDVYGNKIVWRDHRDNDGANLYVYDTEDATTKKLAINFSSQYEPNIYGNNIVWRDYRDNLNDEIYLYDLDSDTERKISSELSNQVVPRVYTDPKIYGNNIIWLDYNYSNFTKNIYHYDLNTSQERKIASNVSGAYFLNLYQDKVVWSDRRKGDHDVYMYDISNDLTSRITSSLSNQYLPDMHNNKIVWRDNRNGNYDIYMNDISTNNEYQITFNLSSQYQPVVYNNIVVWEDARDGGSSIYMREVYTVPYSPIDLLANGHNPSPSQSSTGFSIDWTNPFDSSGIKGAWYKLGSAPTSNEDGTYTEDKPFNVNATAANQSLYVWLENNDNHKDYSTAESVLLRYAPSSSGGGSGGRGRSTRNNNKSNEDTEILNSQQLAKTSSDGTKISSEIRTELSNGFSKKVIESTITTVENLTDTQSIGLDTSGVASIRGVVLDLSHKVLQEMKTSSGQDEIVVNIEGHKAGSNQKTAYARKNRFLVGYDVLSVNISVDGEAIKSFANPLTLSFDISGIELDRESLKVYYFDEVKGIWEIAGDGGSIIDDSLVVEINHLTDFGLAYDIPESNSQNVAEVVNLTEREKQTITITEDAEVVFESGNNLDMIIEYNDKTKDTELQKDGMDKYTKPLLEKKPGLLIDKVYAINNFIVYGTKSTQILGEGERAGVVNSYLKAFGKLPQTEEEWRDCIAIGNGRWPSETSVSAETVAKQEFQNVYKRSADMDNSNDNAAVTIMAYGLRSVDRNLESEKAGFKIFEGIYKYAPINALDWDIVRAIAYSGASR